MIRQALGRSWRRWVAVLAAALHLIFCVVLQLSGSEGSWRWFPAFLLDFPVSVLFMMLGFLPPMFLFGILGSAWWFFVARLLLGSSREAGDAGTR
jgi:hypothetical protein